MPQLIINQQGLVAATSEVYPETMSSSHLEMFLIASPVVQVPQMRSRLCRLWLLDGDEGDDDDHHYHYYC